MAISQFSTDMEIVGKLQDNPVTDQGLTSQQFKDKFDEGGLAVKSYINNTLLPGITTELTNKTITSDKVTDSVATIDSTAHLAQSGAVKTYADGLYDSLDGAKEDTLNDNQKRAIKYYTATASTSWTDSTQTISVSGLLSTDNILVTPAPASFINWRNCGVYCSAQAADSITLTCETTPTVALTVQIMAVGA